MKKHATHTQNDLLSLVEHAQALLDASVDVAGDKVADAKGNRAVAGSAGRAWPPR